MSALPILCYHNVTFAPREARFKLLYVSPDKFERQLWTLRRLGLRGVSAGEGIARLLTEVGFEIVAQEPPVTW